MVRPVRSLLLAGALTALVVSSTLAGSVTGASADLQGRIDAARARERALRGSVNRDSGRIAGFQGRIDDLQQRLGAIQESLAIEEQQLHRLQTRLRVDRVRLIQLRGRLKLDRVLLARQLVAQYETPSATLVTAVLEARGFSELLDRADSLRLIAHRNAAATETVQRERTSVAAETKQLAVLAARQLRVTDAQLVQRDVVTRLKLAIADRELVYERARGRKTARLTVIAGRRRSLENELARQQAASAGFSGAGFGIGSGTVPPTGSFSAHGGVYGFFQAPGTNYAVGDEPQLAARLDQLGKALQLHLIGISGYRTPQHSIEVGGFANDPHTRGQASDTPGVEGVPESVLEHFGLERPFPGAAEADHIQLAGSPR